MTKKLLLTITPADYYFFGGENASDSEDNATGRPYLIRSNRLPQQTAILGVLRHILVKAFDGDRSTIGPQSFDAGCLTTHDFGYIKRLSQLYLLKKENQFFLPAPKLFLEDKTPLEFTFFENGKGLSNEKEWLEQPEIKFQEDGEPKVYSAKKSLGSFWQSTEGLKTVKSDDIFIASLHIGIDKASRMKEENQADDEGFYKQEFIRLADGWAFAVVVEIEDSEKVKTEIFNCSMSLGGENRTVCVRAKAIEKGPEINFSKLENEAIYCTSDAYFSETEWAELLAFCRFSIVDQKPFRSIKTPDSAYRNAENKWQFANLHRGKSELFYLVERGSVFFPKEGKAATFQAFLNQKQPNFQQIGYNQFHF